MNQDRSVVPEEFDIIRTGKGYTMKGWDFTVAEITEALQNNRMLNPTFEIGGTTCPLNCFFCFTQDPDKQKWSKKLELSLAERIDIVKQAHALGARSINIVGAGEPTLDPSFWDIVELVAGLGMTPLVYSEGFPKLIVRSFAQRLYDIGATVVLKVNSLKDEEYQNRVVDSGPRRLRPLNFNYFAERNKALRVLLDTGFGRHDPTRLAFDTIACKENCDEIADLHRFARDNNIFVLLVNYLPCSLSSPNIQNALSRDEQLSLFSTLARIDKEEYDLEHRHIFPYGGGVPCSSRGLGLHLDVLGEVWDCAGQSRHLGNIRKETLKELWGKAAPFRRGFNGGCEPRELAWKRNDGKMHLPVLG